MGSRGLGERDEDPSWGGLWHWSVGGSLEGMRAIRNQRYGAGGGSLSRIVLGCGVETGGLGIVGRVQAVGQ